MMMPTIAGTRIPFLPCLETPNKATMPETKPTAMSKSATSTIIGIIFRATICLSNIKSAKTMRLMTGQTQPSLAARCENDVVFGVVGVSIFGCGLTLLLSVYACTTLCTVGFCKPGCYHALMKADLRISIKDYKRNKNLKIQLVHVPFSASRQFWVRMNGVPWPKDARPVSLTRLLTALRKSLVKSL